MEKFAKLVGELPNQATAAIPFKTDDLHTEERQEAWDKFTEEWDSLVDQMVNLLAALVDEGNYSRTGEASWVP